MYSIFASDNSEPKIIFRIFFLDFLSIFWYNLKVGSLFASDNSEPKIIFRIFSRFFVIFFVCQKFKNLDNSDPKINFLIFFSIFCHFFGVI